MKIYYVSVLLNDGGYLSDTPNTVTSFIFITEN